MQRALCRYTALESFAQLVHWVRAQQPALCLRKLACLPCHGSQHQGSDTCQARQKHRQDGARDCHRGCLSLPVRSLGPILAEVTPPDPSTVSAHSFNAWLTVSYASNLHQ